MKGRIIGMAAACLMLVAAMTLPAASVDEVDPLQGTMKLGHLYPTAVRPFGLASIGPDIYFGSLAYTCTHVQGTGGTGWNFNAPTFIPLTGEIRTDPSAWNLPKAWRVEKGDWIDWWRDGKGLYSRLEARADGLRLESQILGYAIEIVATLRGGLVVARSINDQPLHLLFPLYGTINNHGGTYTLSEAGGVWTISGMQEATVPVYGRFACRGATVAGTWSDGVLTPGAGTVTRKRGARDGQVGVYLTIPPGQELRLRLGVSFTDAEGAGRNLAVEVPHEDPIPIRAAARAEWQAQLDTVQATGGTPAQRRNFATALYRAFQAPHVFEDVDGRYPDFSRKIRTLAPPRRHHYATFSGWDTFRNQMPLVALVDPERYADMCAAMLEMGSQCGLPRWPLANKMGGTMTGEPLEHMLATGRAHGIAADWPAALALMQKTMAKQAASERCQDDGYNGSVAVAALAAMQGDRALAETWWTSTLRYRSFFDPQRLAFVDRGREDRKNDGYAIRSAEGQITTYLWYNGMWDPEGLATLLGGRARALELLKDYMTRGPRFGNAVDFGNENDMHVPFLATLWGDPDLTAATVPLVVDEMVQDAAPRGRVQDDDCGTMSAWVVLSQAGIYPVHPAAGIYVLCPPAFPEVRIDPRRGGRPLLIRGGSPPPRSIHAARWQGKDLDRPWLFAADLIRGGELAFTCGPAPSTWCRNPPPLPSPLDLMPAKP